MADWNPTASAYRAGSLFGINPKFLLAVGRRESGNRAVAVNNWDINAKNGTPSKGPMQFIEPTFSAFARDAFAANPKAFGGARPQWLNPDHQMLVAAWAFRNGKGPHWATYQDALNDVGGQMKGSLRNVPGLPAQGSSHAVGGFDAGTGPDLAARRSRALSFIFDDDDDDDTWDLLALARDRRAASTPPTAPVGPRINTTGMPDTAPAGGWQDLQRIGRNLFGLENDPGNSQTFGGRHTTGSEHYDGRAIDWGNARNTPAQLNKALAYFRSKGYDAIHEGDHIHVSLPGSGI